MQIIDFILNLAAWILWVNGWIQLHNKADIQRPLTLLGTLVGPTRRMSRAWLYFGGFAVLIFLKTILLHYLGAPIETTMVVKFLLLMVYFKTGTLVSMFWMAFASFMKFALIAYIWVWFLARMSREDTAENIVSGLNASLGFLQNRHWVLQMVALVLFGMAGWIFLGIVFGWLGVLPPIKSVSFLVWQSLCISLCAWLALYYLVNVLMILYLIHSYIHLGNWEGWDWLDGVSEKLMSPLSPLPLQWARIDFTPVFLLLLNWLLYEAGTRLVLKVFQYGLA